MLHLFTALSVASLLISVTAFATEVTLTTADNFPLKADYYQAKNKPQNKANRAVLMLHQCNYNRSMYNNIGELLAQRGVHALSLDFRGFGESVSEEYSVAKVRQLPQEQRRVAWTDMSAHWPADVQLAFDYLHGKVTKGGEVAIKIGIIGASCGGSQAITLAEKEEISVISFFSSSQNDKNIARYTKTLAEKPSLIIASEGDGRTFTSAQQLFTTAKHSNSKMISYKGSMHGYPLLDRDKNLAENIVEWFDNNLTNN